MRALMLVIAMIALEMILAVQAFAVLWYLSQPGLAYVAVVFYVGTVGVLSKFASDILHLLFDAEVRAEKSANVGILVIPAQVLRRDGVGGVDVDVCAAGPSSQLGVAA